MVKTIISALVLAAALLGSLSSPAQPTHYGTPTTAQSATATTTISSHTVGSASNRVLIVVATARNNGTDSVSGITWNTSEALTLIRVQQQTTSIRTEVWRLIAPTEATADVVITWTGAPGESVGGASNYQDVDQSTPSEADAGTNGSGTSASTEITTVNADALLVDAICQISAAALAPGTGQTERWEHQASFEASASSDEAAATAQAYTQTYSWSASNNFAHVVVALKAVSGAAPAARPKVTVY